MAGPRVYLLAAFTGVATFAVVYAIDALLMRLHLHAEATIIDDILIGLLVAGYVVFLDVRSGLRRQRQQLAVIDEMNHHIRNALQMIVHASYLSEDKAAIEKVREATQRIEWALREVLPGEAHGQEFKYSSADSFRRNG